MSTDSSSREEDPRKSFAEVARLMALQLSKQRGLSSSLLERSLGCRAESVPDEIMPRLYLGDYFHASDESVLARLGITHVISVLETSPSFDFKSGFGDQIVKLHISLRDLSSVDITRHFDYSTEFIRSALEEPDSRVLVHCFQGISRSATIVAAYILATQPRYTSVEEVVRFLQTKRHIVSPNYGFMQQLTVYAKARAALRENAGILRSEKAINVVKADVVETESIGIGDCTEVGTVSTSITKEASDTVYTEHG